MMWQVNTPHFYAPSDGTPERFMEGRAVVGDDDPAVRRNPDYFTPLNPSPPETSDGDQPRRATTVRRRRGG